MSYEPYTASNLEKTRVSNILSKLNPIELDMNTVIRFTTTGIQVESGHQVHLFTLQYSSSLEFDGSALDQNAG
jgi:hypothetical protein